MKNSNSERPLTEQNRRRFLADIVSGYRYAANISDLSSTLDEIEGLFEEAPTETLKVVSSEMAEYLDDCQSWLGQNGHLNNGHLQEEGEHRSCDACRRMTEARRLYDRYELAINK